MISNAFANLFSQVEEQKKPETYSDSALADLICKDKKFVKKLKSELKYFEICIRIFEETYIGAILHAKNEILEKHMISLKKKEVHDCCIENENPESEWIENQIFNK